MSKGLHRAGRRRKRPGSRRLGGRAAIVAGAVVLAMIVIGLPLAAAPRTATGSTTDGAAADCVVASVGENLVRIICGITDLSRDGDSVYIGWRTTSGGVRSIYHREGAGHTISVTGYAPTAAGEPPHRVLWRVCRDRQAPWRDTCSEWRTVWATPTAE
ncbi:hypothetical protein [Cryptosporangium arvum]|uniref:Ig-like domain-containing protein n=1 Tax=Cryptosporangium arvum DSM 44712 TaxID=927661 RepID=A0A010ZQI9_9ACTN|nr:hypothetical protein [Cryptosporangium arvum]EXG79477.1 hypothetical protein CryarDRAFT_0518 [Cryptosporangium arvum DSM 44712]